MELIKVFKNKLVLYLANFSKREKLLLFFASLVITLSILNTFFWVTPKTDTNIQLVRIETGSGLNSAAKILQDQQVIRSNFWFKIAVVLLSDSKGVKAGDYLFENKENVFHIAYRLTKGIQSLRSLRITIPEGLNVYQTADILNSKLTFLKKDEFVKSGKEGYLFPDTYFFLPNATSSQVIEVMQNNFDLQVKKLERDFASSTRKFEDIIKMASIIEEEAMRSEDKRIVSGILWNRLDKKFPLQVDSSFSYVNGKNTYQLTLDDLDIESPYNTYRNLGLPPTPISNPGLDSILAALYPEKTDHMYFLSDTKGNIYYAETFEGHQENREKYLRK